MIYKASKHEDSMEENGFPAMAAYILPGFFFGWAVLRHLHNGDELEDEGSLERFRARELRPSELLHSEGGVLDEETLGEDALAFAESYFGYGDKQYFQDCEQLLAVGDWRAVEDRWENFDKVVRLLDARYGGWQEASR
jgi:hypothetical protein